MRVTRSIYGFFLLLFENDDRAIPSSEPSGYKPGRIDDRHREEGYNQERKEDGGSPWEHIVGG